MYLVDEFVKHVDAPPPGPEPSAATPRMQIAKPAVKSTNLATSKKSNEFMKKFPASSTKAEGLSSRTPPTKRKIK